mgnify:CR=1 FL=1
MVQMKALTELLPMGVKRRESGLPTDSCFLPDSATYPHKARCQEEAKSGPVHRAPRCERDERCGHRSRLTVDSQRIDGMRTGMGTHAWAQAGTSTGTGMSTCISMGMGIANT